MALNIPFPTTPITEISAGGATVSLQFDACSVVYDDNNSEYVVRTQIIPTWRGAKDNTEYLDIAVMQRDVNANDRVAATASIPITSLTSGVATDVYLTPDLLTGVSYGEGMIYVVASFHWNNVTHPAQNTSVVTLWTPKLTYSGLESINATSAVYDIRSSFACDVWEYKVGGGSWATFSTATTTNTKLTLSGLTPNTEYSNVQVRLRRADLLNHATTTLATFTTKSKGEIVSVTDVIVDDDAPYVRVTMDAYNTGYTYKLGISVNGTVIANDISISVTATGRQTKSITLTGYKTAIFNAMSDAATATATYTLYTTISGTTYDSVATGGMRVTESRSKPTWYLEPLVFPSDEETVNFFGEQDIEKGVINGVSLVTATIATYPAGAIAHNGATIDHYYLKIGGVVLETTWTSFEDAIPIDVSGDSVTIVVGAVDSRGFEVTYSITVPVYQYNPIYWNKTLITRRNGYEDTIALNVEATYDPLEVTVDGTTYTNSVVTTLSGRYRLANGAWLPFSVEGTAGDTTISYLGTPIDPLETPNISKVDVEITARDALSSSTLSLTVPSGIPLVRMVDGKVIINGDVIIYGDSYYRYRVILHGSGDEDDCWIKNDATSQYYYSDGDVDASVDTTFTCCVGTSMNTREVIIDGQLQTLDSDGKCSFQPRGDAINNYNCTFEYDTVTSISRITFVKYSADASFYPITATVTNGAYSGNTTIYQWSDALVIIHGDDGYQLPDTISVSGASYTYDNATGFIRLSNPTGAVTINATCEAISAYPQKGDVLKIDMVGDGNATEWRVISVEDNVAELLAQKRVGISPFASYGNKYEDSKLDKYLNSTYYYKLSDRTRRAIEQNIIDQDYWTLGFDYGNPDYIINPSDGARTISAMDSDRPAMRRNIYAPSIQQIIDYLGVTPSMTAADTTWTRDNVADMFGTITVTPPIALRSYNQATGGQASNGVVLTSSGNLSGENGAALDRSVYPVLQVDLDKITWLNTSAPTPSTDHTMTISGNGNVDYCYIVDTNGEMPVQYYTNGQTFTVADGNLIKCYVSNMSKRVTVNGVSQTLDSGFYDFTPTSDCTITMTFAIADKSWIDITTN